MTATQSLREIIEGPIERLLACDAKQLRRAFERGGATQGEELMFFVEKACNLRSDSVEQRRLIYHWLREEVDEFIRQLDPSVINGIVDGGGDFDARWRLVASLARTPAKHRLVEPLTKLGKDIADQAPSARPHSQDEARVWANRFRKVYDLVSVLHATDAQGLEDLLRSVPEWMLALFFSDLGRLQFFGNFTAVSRLATATVRIGAKAAAAVVRSMELTDGPTLRLVELFRAVGVFMRDRRRQWPWEPSVAEAHSWVAYLEQELGGAAGKAVLSFLRQCRDEVAVVAGAVASYLSARPSNHEDVFELMSFHADPKRGMALSDWGGASVSVSTSGSMRRSSIASKVSPDAVDVTVPLPVAGSEIVAHTDKNALVELTLEQTNPEFVLTYLEMVMHSRHRDSEEIVKRICEDPRFLPRLRASKGTMAGVVLAKLSQNRYGQGPLREALKEIYSDLIEKVPTQLFPAIARDVWFLDDENRTQVQEACLRRLPSVSNLSDLDSLLDIIVELHVSTDRLREALGKVSWKRLVPPPEAERHDFELWAARFSQGVAPRPDVLGSLLPAIGTTDLARAYGAQWYGLQDGIESVNSIDQRLAAKAVLLLELNKRDPAGASSVVDKYKERDFQLLFASRLLAWNAGDTLASWTWLDAVSEVLPQLAQAHVNTLLLHVWPKLDSSKLVASVEAVESFVSAWFRDRAILVPEEIWDFVLDRITRLKDHDYDGAAAIAAMELPSDTAVRRAFLQRAIPHVRSRMDASTVVERSRGLSKLREALARVAPDLETLLDSKAAASKSEPEPAA